MLEVHDRLRSLGFEPTSRWAEGASGGAEAFDLPPDELGDLALANDADIERADVVLVLSRERGGRETYAEARFALTRRKAVLWVGAPALSAYRVGVIRCESVDAAIDLMERKVRPPVAEDGPSRKPGAAVDWSVS